MSIDLKLHIPYTLLFQDKPKKKGVFTLKARKQSIMIYCGDKDHTSQLNIIGQTADIDKKTDLFAIARLFRVESLNSDESIANFLFGANAAQANNPASILTVDFTAARINIDEQRKLYPAVEEDTSEVSLLINDYDIYHATDGKVPTSLYTGQSFLKISANKTNRAHLSINQNQTQANAIIVIFDEEGIPIRLLDPSEKDQSYHLNKIAYAIPFIKPTRKIVFEVGDPEDDGEVEYGDE